MIDEEIGRILRSAADRAEQMLQEHRAKLDTVAQALEQEETLDEPQIEALIGPPSHRLNGAAEVSNKADVGSGKAEG